MPDNNAAKKTDADAPPPEPTYQEAQAAAQAQRTANAKAQVAAAAAGAKPTRHLMQALMSNTDLALPESGAALMIAHAIVELGEEKVHKMSGAEGIAYADRWRKDHPQAWPAIMMGAVIKHVNFMTMARAKHGTVEEYQAAIARIAPPERQLGF
jgi:hypothetical protein